jgi:flavin reductase (DIM6/NTAB) family NADH-FMN oxidoreductase RutF
MEAYKLLYPMRICLITSRYEKKDNIMTAAWVSPVSWDPVLFAVAVGKERFSCQMIRSGKAFGINLPDGKLSEESLLCGTESGKETDKFSRAGLSREEGKHVPLIKECPVSIECEVVNEMEAGDHVIFVGKPVTVRERFEAKGLYQAREQKFITL